jgi:hypothetical protein
MDTEETVLERLRDDGYVHDFTVKGEAIACPECDVTASPESVTVDETHRFEGTSDPDYASTVFALSDGPCGHKGVLVTAFGPAADAGEAEVLRRLGGEADGEAPADALPDDPITAREAVEQVLIADGRSEDGAELGDEMP